MKATPFERASRLSDALQKVLGRIVRCQKHARRDLDMESVHDLRVALRRCRSLAEGFAEIDPRPIWRDLRKACAKQQSSLSELRDSQVMAEWMDRLGLSREPHGEILATALEKQGRHGRRQAKAALKSFSRRRWKGWLHSLPEFAGSLSVGGSRLARIAFDRAVQVCLLERRWRRTRSGTAWHRLRVGVKRFRYAVESFLPAQHAVWGKRLKLLQDTLGEGHDLDVLRGRILQLAPRGKLPKATRERWLQKVADAREKRTLRYLRTSAIAVRERVTASTSRRGQSRSTIKETYVYDVWRAELVRLAKVNLEDVAKTTRSKAIRG